MAYSTGILRERVVVQNRTASTEGTYGRNSAGTTWEDTTTLWAAVDFSRGIKSMREGALDAYDTIMVRTRWCPELTRESRLVWDGRHWNIQSYHAVRQDNTIQITATEIVSNA